MTTRSRGLALAVLVLSLVAAPRAARADGSDSDKCLDASSGAQDLRTDKKLVESREKLLICAREVCPAIVRRDCARWLSEVESQIPSVVIAAKDARGQDVIEATVSIDGKVVAQRLDGRALSVDPGVHVVRVTPTSGAPLEQSVVVREGERSRSIELTVAGKSGPELAPVPDPAGVSPASNVDHVEPPPAEPSHGLGTRRILGITAAGVGVVGLGVGIAFGARASSQWSDAKDACGASCTPGSAPYGQRDDARSSATISTISVIAGAAFVVGGAVLFFTAPSRRSSAAVGALSHVSPFGYATTF